MSFSTEGFRSPVDDKTPTVDIEPINFTNAAVRRNFALELNLVAKEARIENNDSVQNITVRLHSNRGVPRTVPPNSELIIRQWFSEIHVEPNAGATGTSQLEVSLVRPEDARRRN
jgi:hypothetical protein